MPIIKETYREDVVKNIWAVDGLTAVGYVEVDKGGKKRKKQKKKR